MRRKPSDGAARDAAAQLNGSKDLFHARDRRARKCFSVELHFEAAVLRIADLDGRGVLARAAKEKFAEAIGVLGIFMSGASQNKSAGAVAEESAEFARDAARSERSAVHIGGDDRNSLSLSRSNQRLRDGEGVEQTKTSASGVQRAAIFTDKQPGMQLGRKRRIIVMRFAGRDDPIEMLRSAGGTAQRFLRGFRGKRQLVFVFRNVGE